ncbi:MAG: excinuclease ABC subunit C, partial [Erysipelotrichaceae bacterium]|nr:excinuclease ABC subunit C [Erysipelotrichaceae bacterium]
LKNRVNSYFIGAHDYKTTKLVSEIRDFDFIVTKSEKEALILEYNLIKEYDPKFNIVFKDDKTYPYILLSDSKEPYCQVVRKNKKSRFKGKLFGPYTDVTAARNIAALINKLFPTRKCARLKDDLCLYYHLKQCPGYCVKEIDEAECEAYKEKIARFLKGDTKEILNDLRVQMDQAVEQLDFEKAAELRDLINDVSVTVQKQDVQKNDRESFDVFHYAVEDGYFAITGLFIKEGRLLSTDKYLDYLVGDIENAVSSYIYQFYQINPGPKKLYVPKELLPYLEGAFDFEVLSVSRGHKLSLLKQAKENSLVALRQNKSVITRKDQYTDNLKEEFHKLFGKDIDRIELFDNSHTAGVNTVAAMVVYEHFRPNKKEYRLYKIEDGADDLASMREVLYRRYFRVLKDRLKRPDLLIVDGGENQIKVAVEILTSLGMDDILICGLGKDDSHNTSYLMDRDCRKIKTKNDSSIFFFLANAQDEVHRFAITYHKKLRRKAMYKSFLDDIEGLGPKYRKKLLNRYKTIASIKEQSLEELETVLPKNVALRLYNKIQDEKHAEESQ